MEKAIEIEKAKKRRAKLLDEFNRSGWTKSKLARKHGMTPARMGQLLKKAIDDLSVS